MNAPKATGTGLRVTELLSVMALLVGALLLAMAWSDGLPPLDCPATQRGYCDAENADLLLPGILASGVAVLISLVGAATARGRHVWVAGAMLLVAIALGVATLLSIPLLVPGLGE